MLLWKNKEERMDGVEPSNITEYNYNECFLCFELRCDGIKIFLKIKILTKVINGINIIF